MDYEVTLIDANIEGPAKGQMRLGLSYGDAQAAEVAYSWTPDNFTARFTRQASTMPVPAHPLAFLHQPILAIQALKSPSQLPTDVFADHKVFIQIR